MHESSRAHSGALRQYAFYYVIRSRMEVMRVASFGANIISLNRTVGTNSLVQIIDVYYLLFTSP